MMVLLVLVSLSCGCVGNVDCVVGVGVCRCVIHDYLSVGVVNGGVGVGDVVVWVCGVDGCGGVGVVVGVGVGDVGGGGGVIACVTTLYAIVDEFDDGGDGGGGGVGGVVVIYSFVYVVMWLTDVVIPPRLRLLMAVSDM